MKRFDGPGVTVQPFQAASDVGGLVDGIAEDEPCRDDAQRANGDQAGQNKPVVPGRARSVALLWVERCGAILAEGYQSAVSPGYHAVGVIAPSPQSVVNETGFEATS